MIDLLSPSTLINPYPVYNKIREEQPVSRVAPDGSWLISRFNDVTDCLMDQESFTSKKKQNMFSPEWLKKECQSDLFMATEENPKYRKLRQSISPPFGKHKVVKLAPLMHDTASLLANSIANESQFNFFGDFAYPYIGRIMNEIIGLDGIQPIEELQKWIHVVELATVEKPNQDIIDFIEPAILTQKARFEQVIHSKRSDPKEDFISELVSSKVDGTLLDVHQLVNALELLIRSGFQSTVHLLSISTLQLAWNPSIREQLRRQPELLPAFVDEMLRLYSSAPIAIRHATKDISLQNVTIMEGEQVFFSLAAANRDPRQFTHPDDIDLTRESNKEHVAFGFGPRMCMALHLARIEVEIAITHLLPLIENMSCPESQELKWMKTLVFRGLENLTIRLK